MAKAMAYRALGLTWLLTGAAGTASCKCSSPSEPAPSSLPPSGGAAEGAATDSGGPAVDLATDELEPTPIRVTVADLPEPFHTDSARKSPQVVPMPDDARLNVPKGFRVNIYAEGLDRPRWLALAPNGDVLVTETRENRIRRLGDDDGDGAVDRIETFATAEQGLDIPFGMAFGEGVFLLGNHDGVFRWDAPSKGAALSGQGELVAALPGGGYNQHWTRNVIPAPGEGQFFVSIGSRTNVDPEPVPRASVQKLDLATGKLTTFATGLRNPVGLAVHPTTGELYTTVNERDGLGDDLVPDYFTRVREGEFFGWPYAYLTPDLLDPRRMQGDASEDPDLARQTKTPDVLFQAHSAALGVVFYAGEAFPERYRGGAFVAFRGSWNRDSGTGYKLVHIPFEDGRPKGYYEDFLTGFLIDPSGPTTWGRPVGMLVLPDGSLLFTEEMNGRIFRVRYAG